MTTGQLIHLAIIFSCDHERSLNDSISTHPPCRPNDNISLNCHILYYPRARGTHIFVASADQLIHLVIIRWCDH